MASFVNIYEDERGYQFFGSLQPSRRSADEGASVHVADWHGRRRRVYLLRIKEQRGLILFCNPMKPCFY